MASRNVIDVIGFYNKHNIGDESYKISLPMMFPDSDVTFGSNPSADICLVGGGDILSESFLKIAEKHPAKKKIAVSVSAGRGCPLEYLKMFDHILVRDTRSIDWLSSNNITCEYTPDVSTSLIGDSERGKSLLRSLYQRETLELYQKVIGVVLNAHLFSSNDKLMARDFNTFVKAAQDIANVADSTNASFVFFPMSTGVPYDDRVSNGFSASRCKFWKKNLVIYDRLSVQETLDLIAGFDAVISTRLHSDIFCLSNKVPFIDITHHDKNHSFLETAGLLDRSISYWNFSAYELQMKITETLQNSEELKKRLQEIHCQQLNTLKGKIRHVCFSK